MKTKTFDWLLTTYGRTDKVIEAIIIEERTEQEAESESWSYVIEQKVKDHTIVKLQDEVKRFIEEYGLKHKEAKNLEGFSGGISAESEGLINVGYVWVDKFKKWLNKNNSSYDERDEVVLDYIREKYC